MLVNTFDGTWTSWNKHIMVHLQCKKKKNSSWRLAVWAIVVFGVWSINRACPSSSKVGKFDERRPKISTSESSVLKIWHTEIWFLNKIAMYLLHVTGDQVFSTQRRVIFCNPLDVTDDHSSSNRASNSRPLHMYLNNYKFWLLLFNYEANNRCAFKTV